MKTGIIELKKELTVRILEMNHDLYGNSIHISYSCISRNVFIKGNTDGSYKKSDYEKIKKYILQNRVKPTFQYYNDICGRQYIKEYHFKEWGEMEW